MLDKKNNRGQNPPSIPPYQGGKEGGRIESNFPVGTPVRIVRTVLQRDESYESEAVGLVEGWMDEPTGSWYAHGKNDRYWLQRLKLRKADGELTVLVIDDATRIAKIETAPPE